MFGPLRSLFAHKPTALERVRSAIERRSPSDPDAHWTTDLFPSLAKPGAPGTFTCHLGTTTMAHMNRYSGPTWIDASRLHFSEEYFEWTDLFEACLSAGDTFTFAEIGAGFGRWSARAAAAARHQGKAFKVLLVEGEPHHIGWAHEHMANHNIGPDDYVLVEAAIGDERRTSLMSVTMPGGYDKPDIWYGQAIGWGDYVKRDVVGEYAGRPVFEHDGYTLIEVPEAPLSDVLKHAELIDLLDMDIQGAEARAIRGSIDALTATTRRVHIETHHGEAVEIELRQTLSAAGWECLRDYPCTKTHVTPFGTAYMEGGVQTWVNPKLL